MVRETKEEGSEAPMSSLPSARSQQDHEAISKDDGDPSTTSLMDDSEFEGSEMPSPATNLLELEQFALRSRVGAVHMEGNAADSKKSPKLLRNLDSMEDAVLEKCLNNDRIGTGEVRGNSAPRESNLGNLEDAIINKCRGMGAPAAPAAPRQSRTTNLNNLENLLLEKIIASDHVDADDPARTLGNLEDEILCKRPQNESGTEEIDMGNKRVYNELVGAMFVPGDDSNASTSSDSMENEARENLVDLENDVIRKGPPNDLAVAMAVETEREDEEIFPEAVEYDPDAKPPITRNRRFRLYGTLGAFLFVVAIIMTAIAIVKPGSKKSKSASLSAFPTPVPSVSTNSAKDLLYLSIFADVVGISVYEPGSVHEKAADWIIHKDPLQLNLNADNLIQRFVLVFVYFHSTNNGGGKWRSCNPPKEDETTECMFARPTNNRGITYSTIAGVRWLSGTNECSWVGVTCTNGTDVIELTLDGQQMSGSLPTELILLRTLQFFDFSFNDLTGSLPPEYSEMKHLLDIVVHYNLITGEIPEEFYDFNDRPLISINLSANLITGTISTKIGLMQNLKGIYLFDNFMRGSIPSEIGKLSNLIGMRCNNNTFTGTLPTELMSLEKLVEFHVAENRLNGSLPTELGAMTKLTNLYADHNEFTGTIPEVLYNIEPLRVLSLAYNKLTGTISTKVGMCPNLVQFRIAGNPITGTIPTEVADIRTLHVGWFHLTLLSGSMPLEVCDNMGRGRLEFLQTDCYPPENPSVPCRCCSSCCDRETGICLQL